METGTASFSTKWEIRCRELTAIACNSITRPCVEKQDHFLYQTNRPPGYLPEWQSSDSLNPLNVTRHIHSCRILQTINKQAFEGCEFLHDLLTTLERYRHCLLDQERPPLNSDRQSCGRPVTTECPHDVQWWRYISRQKFCSRESLPVIYQGKGYHHFTN